MSCIMKSMLAVLLFVLLPVLVICADSDEKGEEETVAMQDVIITATRTEQEILDVPQHVTVITEEEIKESGVKSVAEILNKQSGASVSDYGATGALKTVSLRGSTSEQVLVLIDGVRINNAQSGSVDLSLVPVENIERIEIVRGGTSAYYGSDAIGGVINIITKKTATNRFSILVANGGYIPRTYVSGYSFNKVENDPDATDLIDTQKVSIQFSRGGERIAFNSTGSFTTAGNGFIFKDVNNEDRKRENAGFRGGDFTFNINMPVFSGRGGLSGLAVVNEKGVPGPETQPTPEASQADQRYQGTLYYNTDSFFSELLTFRMNAYYSHSRMDYEDPPSSSTHTLNTAGLDFNQEMLFFNSLSLIYGVNLIYDGLDSTDVGLQERVYGGVYIETPIYITSLFTLYPVIRYDYYSDFHGSLNFKFGGVYRLSSSTSLKGSVSKSFRAPTFNDLYWPADSYAEGNPDLQPETSYDLDFGISRIAGSMKYDFFAFLRYSRDVILWQPGDDGIWRPSNWGEALYTGLEASVNVRFLTHFSARASYTLLPTFALSGDYRLPDNKRLPMIPVHEVDFGLQYKKDRNLVSLTTHYESLRYERVSNDVFLSSFFIVNAHYRRELTEKFALLISVDNLFNESYEVVSGYPMPGLFIRTGIEATF